MKVDDLFEMPDYLKKEMSIVNLADGELRFYSEDTVKREFDIIGKIIIANEEFWSIMKKDLSFAVIGYLTIRQADKKIGLQIVGTLDFKKSTDLAFDRVIKTPKHVLQVDSVVVSNTNKFNSVGFNLYKSIIEAGYILISDHTQYEGGKKLWEKIAKLSSAHNYKVFVIDNGNVKCDKNGPIEYSGTNLDDEFIWAEPTNKIYDSKRYVLLMMKS